MSSTRATSNVCPHCGWTGAHDEDCPLFLKPPPKLKPNLSLNHRYSGRVHPVLRWIGGIYLAFFLLGLLYTVVGMISEQSASPNKNLIDVQASSNVVDK